ncbi:IucA/IucC family protein [Phytoactinopolyspora limicola]|uniref:IucA/IucC family protein n=1 Tax=Phytoactinopolyspora limicola TaxID=2715536 RepID=UPI00140E0DE1|nr:IucA/IucC family siderophore biosynthesis protein [Phytoactinopolyspora limicola]
MDTRAIDTIATSAIATADTSAIDPPRLSAWTRANQNLLAKALTEFMYEEIISPRINLHDGGAAGELAVTVPGGTVIARAIRRTLGWWRVDPASLRWVPDGDHQAPDLPDAAQVIAHILTSCGVAPATTAGLVAEVMSSLRSDAWQLATARPVGDLPDLAAVLVERELGGHPWIVANRGRVGFSADDVLAYSPESGADVRLLWLAADPSLATARCVTGLDHQAIIRDQVGAAEFSRMRALAQLAGLDPHTCVYLPVHPWQWAHRIRPLHAGDLARGRLVLLGESPARYRPQLAVRTLTDVDHPERRYLKLPVSILNTSVYRGLPRERTLAAPALTEWLCGIARTDPFLQETGVILLGEVASVSVAHPVYESIPGVPYQHTEMLGAIWRDSVEPFLEDGEQAVSLAALLHVGADGTPFTSALVERSGLDTAEWFRRLHHAVLPPLLHVLYKYGTMFSPHGQNCMIVHHDGVPTRLVVKDFVDDVAICSEPLPEHNNLAAPARAALADVTLDAKTLVKYLQNGLLICVYRYLAEIAGDRLGLPEPDFWAMARQELVDYQRRFDSELSDRFVLLDLETPTFPKLCLNRLRLFDRGYADDAERPVISATGVVANPLAPRFAELSGRTSL